MTHAAPLDSNADPAAAARALGVSSEAVELLLHGDVIDLHVDSFIWTRVLGYDLRRRHGRGLLGARYYSQVDFPRMREGGVSGALWSITTNPLGTAAGRTRAFARNLAALREICGSAGEQVELVRDAAGYRAARARGRHAVWLSIQGGNALDGDPRLSLLEDGSVVAVTLVHLTRSRLGGSTAFGRGAGLTDRGREYVARLNELRVFVDLAHISPQGFSDALACHDRTQPLLVTHTGVSAVHRNWRNLDDAQIRAVAETGGVVGIIFHGGYLGGGYWTGGRARLIAEHIAHVVDTVGEDHVALGSDWDGAIITPGDMRTCLELPRLVQHLLDRGYGHARIQKILAGNFLRALTMLRG
jgi:membrane dipeptidase